MKPDRPTPKALLDAALWYARYGLYVVRLHTPLFDAVDSKGKPTRCTCEEYWRYKGTRSRPADPEYVCATPGKHPRVGYDWEEKATRDEDTIRRWWKQYPNANVGFAPGKSGLVVIDDDMYHRAEEEGADLAFADKETVTDLTGGGGEHLIYLHPEDGPDIRNDDRNLPDWVNVRAHGGMAVLPPSLHPSGRQYAWEPDYGLHERDPAALPDALRMLVQGDGARSNGGGKQFKLPMEGKIAPGKRHSTLVSVAASERARGMSQPVIEATLTAVAEHHIEQPKGARPVTPEELRDIAEWAVKNEPGQIPGANGEGPVGPDGEPAKGWTVALANAIYEDNYFAMSKGGELHYYEGGRYRDGGKTYIKRCVKRLLLEWGREGTFTSYRANEVAAYIAADASELWARPPAGTLNVANGILDLQRRKLTPHTPEYLSSIQIPVTYDPEATCPAWEGYIADWFPEDALHVPWGLLALLLDVNVSLQNAVLLLGNGGNGKSRMLAAVKAFLGAGNVAALSLHQIENSRWATHRLNGKIANICLDLPSQHLETSSMFKALTGGDMIPAEVKHGALYEYEPFVRLLFSANQPPQAKDATKAFFRRWLVIPFDATFKGKDRIPANEIDEQMAAPGELSGALNKALDALPSVAHGRVKASPTMEEAHREFHAVTDPVEVWLTTNLIEDPDAWVVKGDVTKAYNTAARANGWPVLNHSNFCRQVLEWRPDLRSGQRRVGDNRPTVWLGVGVKAKREDD